MSTEILIIDDNADIRNIINDLIIEAGYKTRLAALSSIINISVLIIL